MLGQRGTPGVSSRPIRSKISDWIPLTQIRTRQTRRTEQVKEAQTRERESRTIRPFASSRAPWPQRSCHCAVMFGPCWVVSGWTFFRQGTRSKKPLGLSLSKPTNVAGMAGWWQSVLVAVLGFDMVPRMTLIQSLPPSSAHPSSTASSWALQAPDARSGCSGARLDPSRGQKRC